ncbi:MAG: WxcM-like domain-containing protein [Flavobacteriales bacterium]|nr:WxcM-like domain-containing protein [Flavobacteriales bacterium]
MSNIPRPYIIEFDQIGDPSLGYISVAEKETLPFIIQRVYWTYYTPESVRRGGHAHFELEQILIATAGRIVMDTELSSGEKHQFVLDRPNLGLYIPKLCWREMQYSHNAVQVCLASMEYTEKDYIRDYSQFKKII